MKPQKRWAITCDGDVRDIWRTRKNARKWCKVNRGWDHKPNRKWRVVRCKIIFCKE